MKKISVFMFSCVLFLLLVPAASAYPGGLLNGMDGVLSTGGTTSKLTDNNDSTKQSIYNNSVTFTLRKTADLTRIRANVTYRMNGTFRVSFYSDSGVLIAQKSGFGIGTQDYAVDFKSVRKVVLHADLGGDGWNTDLAEFDVFGTYQLARPDNVQVVPGIKQLKITFNTVTNAAGYLLYVDGQKFKELDTNEYVMSDLIPDKVYSIKVTSVFTDGESGFSKELQAAPYADVITPVLKVASTKWNSVGLEWTKPNSSSREVVYQNDSPVQGTLIGGTYIYENLKPNTDYKFVVTMYDKYGRFLSTNAVNVKTPDKPPGRPLSFSAALDKDMSTVLLTWQKANDAAGYRLYVSKDNASFKAIGGVLEEANYVYKQSAENVTLYFRLISVSSKGIESDPASTSVDIPRRTTQAETQEGDGFLVVTWKPVKGATGYNIYLNNKKIGTAGAGATSFKITKAMGYDPKGFAKTDVRAVFADGSLSPPGTGSGGSGGSSGGGPTTDGMGFDPSDVWENAAKIVFSLASFLLLGIVIRLAPRLFKLLRTAILNRRGMY